MQVMNFGADVHTMTSREIAELTGKQHKHVLVDIRKMLEDLDLRSDDLSVDLPDSYGRMQPGFQLPKRETLILVSGYSIPMRARIVDRWEALETGKAVPSLRKTGGYTMNPPSQASEVTALQLALISAQMSADILRIEGSARLGMVRQAHELAGAGHLLPMLPVYAIDAPSGSGAGSSEATASLSALMKANGIKGTAATMNVRLEMHGFLEKKNRAGQHGEKSFWSVTEAGQKYGKNLTSPQNQRETQPHWYRDKFLDLMSTINAK